MSDNGYRITWEYIVDQMRKRYKIAPTDKTPRSMGEIERMINEIWYEYPGYDAVWAETLPRMPLLQRVYRPARGDNDGMRVRRSVLDGAERVLSSGEKGEA